MSLAFAAATSFAVVAPAGRATAAPGVATADEIAAMNRRASDEYESLNFDKARNTLTAALESCQRAGLARHRVAADAHLLMGLVILAGGVKQSDEAAAEFRRALEIRPSIQVPERLANPEIQQVFAQAAATAAALSQSAD
ncbi:MAG TPA: tetratricopeptide repeat protein, partial [Polyangia bacterium]